MATQVARQTYSFDDLERLAEEFPHKRLELIDGELFVAAAPTPPHEIITVNLLYPIETVLRPGRLGRVFTAPVAVRFTPQDVLEPDLCVVLADRLHIVGPKAIDGAPDLVVEILSPSTRVRDIREKRAVYARFGVREYWTVDPDPRTVTVELLHAGRYVPAPAGEGVVRSTVLPGLMIPVADVFDGVGESGVRTVVEP